MEYVFKKDDMQALINAATKSNVIVVSIDFSCDIATTSFKAEITAKGKLANRATDDLDADNNTITIHGCPRPPGCPGSNYFQIIEGMNII